MPLGLVVLWLPAALWLLSQDQTGWAVFILAWNGLLVGMLDNVLRPYQTVTDALGGSDGAQ